MELSAAQALAIELMKKHKLTDSGYSPSHGWYFEFDRSKRRFGCCHYSARKITLSRELTLLNEEYHVRDVLLHEIAHALAPRGAGHGRVWKAQAKDIGCNAMRCYGSEVVTPPCKYLATCPTCGKQYKYHKKRTGIACGKCCNGVYDPKHNLVFTLLPQ